MSKWNRKNNCFSYAFNKPNFWLLMENYDGAWDLLEQNPNLKMVSRKDMVLGKEYIAYRFGKHDFHFMKRGKKGHWRHKMGSSDVESISAREVFAESWCCGKYNSKLYLFEVLN